MVTLAAAVTVSFVVWRPRPAWHLQADKLPCVGTVLAPLPSSPRLRLLRSAAELEVRDITAQPEWESQYSLSIPVLAAAAGDGSGEVGAGRGLTRVERWQRGEAC